VNESLDRLESLFAAALQEPPAGRAAYLDQACADDPGLRQRVEALLRAQEAAGSFLEPVSSWPATVDEPPAAGPETVIGSYKLLEAIGEGGFGVVFMAEQSRPLRRRVALKVLKPGMDGKQIVARFEQERQALALMDHPHIARVFDGGETASGRPYFVMELVRGAAITDFCDQDHSSVRRRLELFASVCHAIQHAHQKGIIHRDIKPSNVLVTRHDGVPVAKVIDFGVAKAVGQPLTERTMFTGFAQMVGTPLYMSPEQAQMSGLDIDTRSDVYSLGVLLYELLTGTTPFSRKESGKAGMLEVLRAVREQEPTKPSTRLSTAEGLPALAANRGTEPAKLTRLVRGELDWIVMKALEKDRNRRYETANSFAMDIQRYLADEPVLACPPSAGYRLRKFARRNKGGLAVAGLVLFFLVLLGSGAGWAWRDRAARAAERANHLEGAVERAELLQREGKRGEALAALERARLLAREAEPPPPLAERIDSLQQRLDAEGRDEVFVARFEAIRREVQTEVDVEKSVFRAREAYPRIREALEHYGIAIGVMSPAAAVTQIQKRPASIQTVVLALEKCLHLGPREDSDTREWLIEVLKKADSDPWRDKVRRAWKQPGALEALARDIDVRQQAPSFLLLVAKALPIESPSRLELERRVQFAYPGDFWANHDLGFDLARAGKHAEAIRYYTAALGLRPDNPGVLLNRAVALREVGELEAAIADYQRAIALAPRYAAAHNNLGNALRDQKKLDEAVACHKKAIDIDPKYALAYRNLGLTLQRQGKLDEAIAAYKNAVEFDPKDAYAHTNLGSALHNQGKLDEAVAAHRKAIEIDPKYAKAYRNLGVALGEQKKWDEAVAAYRKAIDLDPKYAGGYNELGVALHTQKKWPDAIDAFRKAIDLDPKYAAAYSNLGGALFNQKKWSDAIDACRKAIDLDPKYAIAYNNLGAALAQQGKLDDAIAAHRKAIELDPKYAGAYSNLGGALFNQKKWSDAIAAHRKAIELDPKYADAYWNLGGALVQHGKLDDAVAAFRKASELDPKYAGAGRVAMVLNELAWALATDPAPTRRDPGRAVSVAKEAVEMNPQEGNYHNTLGVALYRAERWEDAIAALEKSMKLRKGGDSNDWFFLAMAHWQLGEKEKAREWYERAVQWMDRNQPKNEVLRRFRAEAAELLGLNEKK
jgi:serine/threonine-protein kinase